MTIQGMHLMVQKCLNNLEGVQTREAKETVLFNFAVTIMALSMTAILRAVFSLVDIK